MTRNNLIFSYAYPDAPTVIRKSFDAQEMMKTINARLSSIKPGKVEIEMDFQPALTQQHGYLHAGVVTTLVDSACGFAAFSLMPEGSQVLSVEFKVNLLAPAFGKCFLAIGQVLKAGRTLTVCKGELITIKGSSKVTSALMQATMMCMPKDNYFSRQ